MATIADVLAIKLGLDSAELTQGLDKAKGQLKGTGQAMEQLGNKWKGVAGGLMRTIVAPVAGFMSLGAVIKSYFGGVSEVARMTGAYSTKMEEWAKKRAMLARYNREDIELYKKGRQAVVQFQISMADLSAKIMRAVAPAIKWLIDKLNDFSKWVDRNGTNIIRFLSILATVVTVALIPAFARWIKLLWKSPLTGLVLTLGALILLFDDFVTWLRGGESALGDFWEMFGSREEQTERINKILGFFKDHLQDIIKYAGMVAGAFAGWKILTTVLLGVSKAIYGIRTALIALSAHPIVALITAIIGAIMWLISAFQRCDGTVSDLWKTMEQDVIDFLDIFGGIGTKLKELQSEFGNWLISLFPDGTFDHVQENWDQFVNDIDSACTAIGKWFSDVGKSIKQWFTDKINEVSNAWTEFCTTIETWYNKIVGWFKDIGKAIADAFSFDGIKKKFDDLMSSMNPKNWSIFGGGDKETENTENKEKSGGIFSWFKRGKTPENTVPPVRELDSRPNSSRTYSDQSQYSINQNFNISTDNPDMANELISRQSAGAIDNLRGSQSQVNASARAGW